MCNYAVRVVVIVFAEDGNKVFKKLLSFKEVPKKTVVVGQTNSFLTKFLQIFARIALG